MKTLYVLLLVVFWFSTRWISIALSSDAFVADPDGYRQLAIELNSTGVFGANSQPTAFRPPLYPWILSFGVTGSQTLDETYLKWLHSLLGALTCFFVYRLASQISSWQSKQTIAPIIAATLVALDPILVRQSQLIMTETLATLLAAITLYCMGKALLKPTPLLFLIVGIGIGLSVLCRPTAIVWGGLFMAAFFASQLLAKSKTENTLRQVIGNSLAFSLGVGLFVLPWGTRNYLELKSWILTTTHGGYTLLLANNESLYDHFEKTPSRNWDDTSFQSEWAARISGLHELDQDRLANSMAKETIQRRPLLFLKSCVIRFGWLWAPWPNQSSWLASAVIGAWYTTLYMAAIAGGSLAWRRSSGILSHPILLPAACLVLSLSLVHAVYWSNLRMRAVAMPALCVLASIPFSTKSDSTAKNTASTSDK
ncbi:MAG: glycosyltransferase family 39 protein [Pirellula sp.]|nr:glycosyltransferase family 39 protein [Pirellula sp.]